MRFAPPTSWILMPLILSLALACGGSDTPESSSSPATGSAPGEGRPEQGITLNDGRLLNHGAAYSLAVPAGWLLYDQSTPERVVLQGPGVKVAFAILARPRIASLEEEAASLETTLSASEMKYEPIDRGTLEIGGLPARRIVFRGTIQEMSVVAENYLVQTGNITFILGFEAEESQRELLAADVRRIVESIRFGSPGSATPA